MGENGALTRRQFLGAASGLALTWGLPVDLVAGRLGQPAAPAEVTTSLVRTIRKAPAGRTPYRRLVERSGEPFTVREDLILHPPAPGRANTRRSLLYMGQFTDIHIVDAQSPARIEPAEQAVQALDTASAARPQETLCVYVLDQMVKAMNEAASSPVTGAPLSLAIVTGDMADSHALTELRWYIDTLDGKRVTPNSGRRRVYEGIQAWGEADYAYHPDGPAHDMYGRRGYPAYKGMLEAAVSTELHTVGLPIPWYAVYGNHDTVWMGLLPIGWMQEQAARGSKKASTDGPYFTALYMNGALNGVFERELMSFVWDNARGVPGMRTVTKDHRRRIYERFEFVKEHFRTAKTPGPVGHGFTAANLRNRTTWWAHDVAPRVRLLGLDTCNTAGNADGCVYGPELRWVESQLRAASSRYYDADGTLQTQSAEDKLVLLCSHHTSWTLENTLERPGGENQSLHTGPELVEMLLRFPNVVAWINGHTHYNRIVAHPSKREQGAGFWEVNTASCIDWAQQQRLVELVDNRDGTLSIFTVTLDHKGPARTSARDYSPAGLAAISRELAANHWFAQPDTRLGGRPDRNCELVVKAPFDLSGIGDAELERAHLSARTRLLARTGGAPT